MTKRKVVRKVPPRPLVGEAYQRMIEKCVRKVNETNFNEFRDLDGWRYAAELFHKRMFPDEPLPVNIKGLRRRYERFEEADIVQSS